MTEQRRQLSKAMLARVAAKAGLPVAAAYAVVSGGRAAYANASVDQVANAAIDAAATVASVASKVAMPVTVAYAGYKGTQAAASGAGVGAVVTAAIDAATFGLASYAMSGSTPGNAARGRLASRAKAARQAMAKRAAVAAGRPTATVAAASRRQAAAARVNAGAGGPMGFANPKVLAAALRAQGKRAPGSGGKKG